MKEFNIRICQTNKIMQRLKAPFCESCDLLRTLYMPLTIRRFSNHVGNDNNCMLLLEEFIQEAWLLYHSLFLFQNTCIRLVFHSAVGS